MMAASAPSYWDELARQLFFLSAAGLGAVFAALYPVTTAVTAGTYDEHDDATHIMRLVVGLISGTILGQLIDVSPFGGLGGLTRPTLALVGGFSASLVFKILSRLVEGVESVFSDVPDDNVAAAATAATRRAELQIIEERQAMAQDLVKIAGLAAARIGSYRA